MTTLIHTYNLTGGSERAKPVKRRRVTALESLQRKSEKDTLKISELQEELESTRWRKRNLDVDTVEFTFN